MSGRRNVERGKELEREVARFLCSAGISAARGARNGVRSGEDVMADLPGVRIECKRTRTTWPIAAALAQARRDAPESIPLVVVRRDREQATAIVPLEHLVDLARAIVASVTERE